MELVVTLIVVLVFQSIGISASVLTEIGRIRKIAPKMTIKEVWSTFKQEDWNTLIWSGVVLFADLSVHTIMYVRGVELTGIMAAWWFDVLASMVLGWGGQDIFVMLLGTTKKAVIEKIGGIQKTSVQQEETDGVIKTTVQTETITPKNDEPNP